MNVLEELKGAETVGITGHIRPDGDCIGSCMGLYSYLKDNCPQLDVTVYLETPGSEFHYIRDIDKIQTIPDIKKEYDVFFVLDCSSLDRIEPFHSCFENAKKTVCIFKAAMEWLNSIAALKMQKRLSALIIISVTEALLMSM